MGNDVEHDMESGNTGGYIESSAAQAKLLWGLRFERWAVGGLRSKIGGFRFHCSGFRVSGPSTQHDATGIEGSGFGDAYVD